MWVWFLRLKYVWLLRLLRFPSIPSIVGNSAARPFADLDRCG